MNKKIIALSVLSLIYCGFANSAWNRGSSSVRTNPQQNRAGINQSTNTASNDTSTSKVATNIVLPIDVKNETLKQRILSNDSTSPVHLIDLQNCANIWNGGVFIWGPANAGTMNNINRNDTCTAVITLRDSNTNSILATANVGANGHFKCNIDSFPNESFTEMIQNVTFPADKEPTEEEVRDIMNSERKENAGFKAAAGAIIGGLAGNLAVKSDYGKSALSFGDKDSQQRTKKILGTLGGATVMGGAMYATTQMDTVAGTTAENTIVNATGGAFLGNIYSGATGGDSDHIKTIKYNGEEYTVGRYFDKDAKTETQQLYQLFDNEKEESQFYNCKKNTPNGNNTYTCTISYITPKFSTDVADGQQICLKKSGENTNTLSVQTCNSITGKYLKLMNVETSSNTKLALGKIATKDKKGKEFTYSAFYETEDGETPKTPLTITQKDFMPLYTSAGDGGVIDFSNKGRAKATAIGGVGGGAIGGFSGYQQAQSELSDRYTTAVQTYKDSLKKFYCVSGGNVLGFYNEEIIIPAPSSNN